VGLQTFPSPGHQIEQLAVRRRLAGDRGQGHDCFVVLEAGNQLLGLMAELELEPANLVEQLGQAPTLRIDLPGLLELLDGLAVALARHRRLGLGTEPGELVTTRRRLALIVVSRHLFLAPNRF
jgi:hypothetical protein